MYEIKEQFINRNNFASKYIEVTLEDGEKVVIDTKDNSNMTFETFNKICRSGHSYLFDFSKKIDITK